MISEDSIKLVKESSIIQEVIGDFVKLKKVGSSFQGLCPFHNEKTPSFSVHPARQSYKCFGCGKGGDSVSFLMELEKLTFIDAIKWLANRFNITIEEEAKQKNYIKPLPRLEKLSKKTLDWFENERKISNNTLLRLGITEGNEFMPQLKIECPSICFNYYNKNNELVNIKFRGPKKSFKLSKDAELIFYNLPAIIDSEECIIVEGEIDCASLHECGIYSCVSVPNGASTGTQRLEYLDNCWEFFENKKKVTLMVDNDAPGNKLKEELARRIGFEKCYVVEYPLGCKDANEILCKLGKDQLVSTVMEATQWPIEGMVTMDDMYETICEFYEKGYPEGEKCNMGEFDEHMSFYPGQLTVITGIPGSGKSEFVDWIMASLTKHHNWSWGICSFENPPEFHATKLAEKFTDKAFGFRKNPWERMDIDEFGYAIGMIDKYFHFMNLNLIDITIDGLIRKAEELVKRKGIKGILLDPWNCIETKYSGENETKYVLECLNKLIIFLDKYKVHGFLVAHPTKLRKILETKKYEIPTLYSISGSAHFFNRAHNGLSIYRDFETNQVDVYIQKIKWSWLGKLGMVSFSYDTFTRRYKPITTGI